MQSVNLLDTNEESVINRCIVELEEGKVIVIPTDTIYGLSSDYFNKAARDKISIIKSRPLSKSYIILVEDIAALLKVSKQVIAKEIQDLLPAPLTLVVENAYSNLYNEKTIAVRIPSNSFLTGLLRGFGKPIISTSFNYNRESIKEAVEKDFAGQIDLCVIKDDIRLEGGKASTILDITQRPYKILRQGKYIVPQKLLKSD